MSITAAHGGDLSRAAAPTPAAERQRRHRARRKHGRFVVQVEVTCENPLLAIRCYEAEGRGLMLLR